MEVELLDCETFVSLGLLIPLPLSWFGVDDLDVESVEGGECGGWGGALAGWGGMGEGAGDERDCGEVVRCEFVLMEIPDGLGGMEPVSVFNCCSIECIRVCESASSC